MMNIIKIILFLPIAFLKVLLVKSKPIEIRYACIRKLSCQLIKWLGYSLNVTGKENINIQKPVYYISNHQGTFDPVILVAANTHNFGFISKIENRKIPFLGLCAELIGTIHFDRNSRQGNVSMLRKAIKTLKNGKSLLVFPEGTRSKGDHMNEFKKGTLVPAYMAKATIIPIRIDNAYFLDKPTKSKKLSVRFFEPLYYDDYKDIDNHELSNKLFDQINISR